MQETREAVDVIKEKKIRLRTDIGELLRKFSQETGCLVEDLDTRAVYCGGEIAFYTVTCEVNVV